MSVIRCSGRAHDHDPPVLGTVDDPLPAPWATWGYLCDTCRQTTSGGLVPRPTHP